MPEAVCGVLLYDAVNTDWSSAVVTVELEILGVLLTDGVVKLLRKVYTTLGRVGQLVTAVVRYYTFDADVQFARLAHNLTDGLVLATVCSPARPTDRPLWFPELFSVTLNNRTQLKVSRQVLDPLHAQLDIRPALRTSKAQPAAGSNPVQASPTEAMHAG